MNALVTIPPVPAMSIPDVERIALAIARGGLFGSTDPNAVLTLCLLAQAEGQQPAVVFRDYHLIQGKSAKKAEAMLRDFVASGGKVEWHQLDDTCAAATFSHPGGGSVRIDWNMERAKAANLATPMWKKYPRQMLRSRVVSEGVRTVYPGATSGLYVPEEVADMTGGEPPIDATTNGGNPQTGEVEANPVKIVGIQKIKNAIREMKFRGEKAVLLDDFEGIIGEYLEQMTALETAQHSWWTGDDGEGGKFEGIPEWIARRREELAQPAETLELQLLLSTLAECDTVMALKEYLNKNLAVVDELDDAERRRWEDSYNSRETAIHAMDSVSV